MLSNRDIFRIELDAIMSVINCHPRQFKICLLLKSDVKLIAERILRRNFAHG